MVQCHCQELISLVDVKAFLKVKLMRSPCAADSNTDSNIHMYDIVTDSRVQSSYSVAMVTLLSNISSGYLDSCLFLTKHKPNTTSEVT